MSERPETMNSPLSVRSRTALLGVLALFLAGCSSNLDVRGPAPYDSDPATTSSANYALFDPSAGVVPLPNILATATVTGISYAPPADPLHPDTSKVYVFPGVPPTSYVNGAPKPSPKDSLAFLNLTEVGGKNAVSGLTSPIKISFQGPVLQSSVTPATVKVYQVIPDITGPTAGLTEVGPLGFRDVSALFSVEWQFTWNDRNTDGSLKPTTVPLANPAGVAGAAFQLVPRLPLTPGSRYVYVVTDGVKDLTTTKPVGQSLSFGFLKYVKGADTNPNATSSNPGTNLAATAAVDPQNPALIAGAASQAGLQSIYGNALVTVAPGVTAVALSGYGKTMDDLVASATADTSGKAAAGAGATGIGTASENLAQRRSHIRLLGRFITTGTVATQFLANTASTQIPVEGALWAWANNTPGTPFAGAPARQWSNVVSGFTPLGSSTIPGPGPGSIDYVYIHAGIPSAVPRAAVGFIGSGTYESGDLNIDPAVAHAIAGTVPPTGNITGTPGAYNPGYYPVAAAPVPGTGVLQGVRPDGNTLTGFLHVNRTVHFWFIAPAAAAPAGGYPVLIYQHGITSQKEDILTAANTICSAGYAILAIDAPLHGENANGRDAAEWGANFMSLLDIPNTRTNIQQGAFNLWRLERVAKESAATLGSLQGTVASVGKPIASAGASKFLGLSLGSIIGAYFMAGNSNQYGLPGASNIPGFFSSPGAKTAYIIRDGKAGFEYQVNASLKAVGVPPGSHDYDQFLLLVQTIADAVDPAWAVSPIKAQASGLPFPSRFSGRLCAQEAIGDTTILNTYGNTFGNFLGGWGLLGSSAYDIAPNFTQVMLAGATSPVVPFMYGPGGLKTPSAPATSPVSGPTEGFFQFGTTANPASHTFLLDFANPAVTAAAQKQLAMWLATGRLIDPADTAHWPIAGPAAEAMEPQKVPFLDALQ